MSKNSIYFLVVPFTTYDLELLIPSFSPSSILQSKAIYSFSAREKRITCQHFEHVLSRGYVSMPIGSVIAYYNSIPIWRLLPSFSRKKPLPLYFIWFTSSCPILIHVCPTTPPDRTFLTDNKFVPFTEYPFLSLAAFLLQRVVVIDNDVLFIQWSIQTLKTPLFPCRW